MQLLSINVSKPRMRRFRLRFYSSAFLKKPVSGKVELKKDNLHGDKQADLANHGGLDKAVYGFSHEHYAYWREKLGLETIDYGKFGENLTISELDETTLAIGDQLQIDDCILEISQPRIPCYKISFEFGDVAMLNNFIKSAKTGIYFRVLQTGTMQAGSEVKIIYKHPGNITINRLFRAYFDSKFPDQEQVMREAVAIPELAEEWRGKLTTCLHRIDRYHQRQKNRDKNDH